VLVIGAYQAPKVSVTTFVSGDQVRVVRRQREAAVQGRPGSARVTVAMPRDLVDVRVPEERLTGGIVDLVQYVGGRENLLAITLGAASSR
jgi:hypothetical protein